MEKIDSLFREAVKNFKVSVERMDSKYDQSPKGIEIVEEQTFESKAEANKFTKEMMKKYDLKKHAGHIVNYSKQLEMFTNY